MEQTAGEIQPKRIKPTFLDARQRGVLKALAKFRIRRRLNQQRKVISFLKETAWMCIVAAIFTQFAVMLLVQSFVSLDMHILLEFYTIMLGTVVGFFVGVIVFIIRLAIRRWPLPAVIEGPSLDIEEIEKLSSSGDLILFSYPVRPLGMFTGHFIDVIETWLLKLQGKIQWTHVAVVLEDENGVKWLAESTTDSSVAGHTGPGMCLLRDRLIRSHEYDLVAWRKLNWDPNLNARTRKHYEKSAFDWVTDLCCKQPAGYRLDFFRGLGKIMWDFGFTNAGSVMLASGFSWDYDCAMFVGAVLRMLRVIQRGEAMLRIFTVAHFSMERKESTYSIDTMHNMNWGPQRLIRIPAEGKQILTPAPVMHPKLPGYKAKHL